MHLERLCLGTLVAAVTLLQAQPSLAYCRSTSEPLLPGQGPCEGTGDPLYWQSECVGFRVSEATLPPGITLRDTESRVRAAFGRWTTGNSVCSPSISVVVFAPSESTAVSYSKTGPNENLIVLGDGNLRGRDYTDEPTLATMSFRQATGEILDGDLEVDISSLVDWSQEPGASDAGAIEAGVGPDLDVALTHAVGHLLGLSHSEDEGSLLHVDFQRLRRGNPELTLDDADGICAIYGDGRTRAIVGDDGEPALVPATPCNFGSSGNSGADCGPADVGHGCSVRPGRPAGRESLLPLFLLAVVGAAVRLRVRRRRDPCGKPRRGSTGTACSTRVRSADGFHGRTPL